MNEGGQASAVFFGHGESFGSRLAATHLSWSCAGSVVLMLAGVVLSMAVLCYWWDVAGVGSFTLQRDVTPLPHLQLVLVRPGQTDY